MRIKEGYLFSKKRYPSLTPNVIKLSLRKGQNSYRK